MPRPGSRRPRPASSRAPSSDETGGRLPGATVTLVNRGTNFTRELITDADGRFRGLLLPLGDYVITVSLSGFGRYTQDGIGLGVGQTRNLPVTLRLVSVAQEVHRHGRRASWWRRAGPRARTQIDAASIRSLPNNGRNFLSFMQLTPGVTIVQGPDGDEISINGQKGISNNISVDGADFNNPFFGEQRGGQRPAFTFNQDAIQEMVVVADGAAAEFGRSGAGFVNVVTKSGTNTPAGSAHFFFKEDSLSWENSDGEKFPFDQQQFGATFGGPIRKDQAVLPARLRSAGVRPDQAARPRPDRAARRRPVRPLGSADENGPIDRTNDARVFLGKVDYQANASNLFTLRYNYTWSEQQNGTFDVDSWGRSANGVERGFLERRVGFAAVDAVEQHAERVPLPAGARGSAAALRRSGHHRPVAAVPRHRLRLRQQLPLRRAVLLPGRVLRHPRADHQQLLAHQGHATPSRSAASSIASTPSQTFIGFANGRYVFGSTQGFLNYVALRAALRRVLERHDQHDRRVPGGHDDHRSVAAVPAAGGRRRPVGGRGGHAGHPAARAVALHPGQVAAEPPPDGQLRAALGSADPARPDHAAERGVLRAASSAQPGFPSDGTIPSDKKMFQPRLGISWDPGGNGKQVVRFSTGPVLRAHSRAEPGQLALDQRQPRPDALPRQHLQRVRRDPADLAEPDSAVGDRQPRSPRRVRVRQGLPEPADVVDHRGLRA